jgi:non-specific serine/threonine protein kinase
LGNAVLEQGDSIRAEEILRESLTLANDLGDRWFLGDNLASLAIAAERQGRHHRAARLIGAVDAVRARTHAPLLLIPMQIARYEQTICETRAQLGDEVFAVTRAAGRSLSLEEAVSEALMSTWSPEVPTHARAAQDQATGGLTLREQEVLKLIVAGYSNRQVAEALFISHRTATTHVGHILAKLDVGTRAEAAAWGVRQGLT